MKQAQSIVTRLLAGALFFGVAYAQEKGVELPRTVSDGGQAGVDARLGETIAAGIPIDQVSWDAPGDGTLWALGAEYKMSFDESGATYYPRLPKAPAHTPISFAIDSITVGGEPLAVDAVASVARTGDTVLFDRGAVQERYELRPADLEQLFVFDAALEGEIVVQLNVATQLSRRSSADHLIFENDLGRVMYSKALAVDANGLTQAAQTSFKGGCVEIRVSAEFVAAATYPLTIDPVVTSFALEGAPEEETTPDLAYDATEARYLYVWERTFNASDHDIRAQSVTASGTPTNAFWIDFTGSDWRDPAIANSNDENEFLVVATRGATGARDIWGRMVGADPVTGVLGDQFEIAGSSFDELNPDVGGQRWINLSGGTNFGVVYEFVFSPSDHDIYARTVTSNGSVSPATGIDTSTASETNPSISNSSGPGSPASVYWILAYQRSAGFSFEDIYGAHYDGTLRASPFGISTTPSDDRLPSVSSAMLGENGREYLVAFQRATGLGDTDIEVRRLAGTAVIASENLTLLESNPNAASSQRAPAVTSDGCKYVVAYRDGTGSLSVPIYASTLAPQGTGLTLEENRVQFASGGVSDNVKLASTQEVGGADKRVGAAWSWSNSFVGISGIEGLLYDIPGPPNDCCEGAFLISGTGAFAFDNTDAGTYGDFGSGCGFSDDVWYDWTAPSAGVYSVSTCGGTTMDTELAVHDGTGCPTGPLIACNDDICDLQSQVIFSAVGGSSYKIRLGTFSPGFEGSGEFFIHRISDASGLGENYCLSNPNSVAASGSTISASGSTSVIANNLILSAAPLPILVPGIFYYGANQTQQPFGEGYRCASGQVFRLPITFVSAGGSATFAVDNSIAPHSGTMVPGFSWNFQYWHRDVTGGPSGFNLSDGINLTFIL